MEKINYTFTRDRDSELAVPYFYEKKYLGYVEGADDIFYWSKKLIEYEINDILLEEVGGKLEISEKIKSLDKCKMGDLNFIFLDKDYDEILEKIVSNKQIIYTYGHSIENSFCCKKNLIEMICDYNNIQKSEIKKIKKIEIKYDEFIKKVEELTKELLIFDILNEKKAGFKSYKAIGFIPDKSYEQFFDKKLKWKKNPQYNLEFFLDHAKKNFSMDEIAELKEKLDNLDWKKCIRGHFFNSICHLFFNTQVNDNLNLKGFNQLLIEKCLHCDNGECSEKKYYKKEFEKIKKLIEEKAIRVS